MTETLQARLIRHEGLRLEPYKDSLGHLTVGVGHKILPTEDFSAGITQQQADDLLAADITKARNDLYGNFPWVMTLDSVRLGILIEMVFQLGIHGVAGFHDMLADLHQKNYEGAAEEMLWDDVPNDTIRTAWHKETPERCEELSGLMLTGAG